MQFGRGQVVPVDNGRSCRKNKLIRGKSHKRACTKKKGFRDQSVGAIIIIYDTT